MSAEDLFERIPHNVRRFRIGDDGLIWYKKDGRNELDVYAKKAGEHVHLHMFFNGDKAGAVLTDEQKRGTAEKRIPFNLEDFLRVIGKMVETMFQSLEQVEPHDPRFSHKKVQICTFPKIELRFIKGGKAYFELQSELKDMRFSEIDASRPQIGAIKGWFGREIALIIVGKGAIPY